LVFEKGKNNLIEETENKERELFLDGFASSSNETKLIQESNKKKNEEILQLKDELARRKEWIMEVERQRNDNNDHETKLLSELRDAKRELEVEHKKNRSI